MTRYKAALWTDGRYFLQADMELDCNWLLQKEGGALNAPLFNPPGASLSGEDYGGGGEELLTCLNPFTPKSDQFQISPGASPEI